MPDSIERFARLRLEQMRTETDRVRSWPQGCYGSAHSVVMFVGPSPGGGSRYPQYVDRDSLGGLRLVNEDFREPFCEWSRGFRTSLKPLIETLLGLTLEEGAYRLFGFANFDWIQTPDAGYVSPSRMDAGTQDVLTVLEDVAPKLVVPMERKSYQLARQMLQEASYSLACHEIQNVLIQINKRAFHRSIDAIHIHGSGSLNGAILLRSPQHPARMFNLDYAKRCATALRACVDHMLGGDGELNIEELI